MIYRFLIILLLLLLRNITYCQQTYAICTTGIKAFNACPKVGQSGLEIFFADEFYPNKVDKSQKSVQTDSRHIHPRTKTILKSIKYETRPAIGIIGNSTIAGYSGGESIASLMNKTSAYSITDISVPGYTIIQEDSLWREIPEGVKQMLNWVFVEIGLNDLAPDEPAKTALSRYQSLIDLIRKETNKSCRIITSTLTPCKQRLIYLYGITDGLIAYSKWLEMNTAIIGSGSDKIINFDSYCSSHTDALSDGKGNLADIYDTGDGIHETTTGRQIIANEWMAAIMGYNERK